MEYMLGFMIPANGAAPVKVACLGDSITAGALVNKEDCWVSRIAGFLDKKAEVGNLSVSARCLLFKGGPSCHAGEGLPDALAFKPDMLFDGLGHQ